MTDTPAPCCPEPDYRWSELGEAQDGTVLYRGVCENCGTTRESE